MWFLISISQQARAVFLGAKRRVKFVRKRNTRQVRGGAGEISTEIRSVRLYKKVRITHGT